VLLMPFLLSVVRSRLRHSMDGCPDRRMRNLNLFHPATPAHRLQEF